MPKKGYRNINSPEERYPPSTYVNQPYTPGDKSIYPPMTSTERDTKLGSLLNKEEKIQEEMDIIEAEARTNKNDMEHNKKNQSELENQKSNNGILSQAIGVFGFGKLPKINKEIEELQSKQAKHERHEQELLEQIRAHVLIQEEILRSKNDINRMFRDSGNDNTDGSRLSIINANYFRICKFIEKYVNGFTFKEPSDFALMHALANEVSRQYFGNENEPIYALYDNLINENMLITTSNEMKIFKNEKNLKAFLEQARQAEQAIQREIAESSLRQRAAHKTHSLILNLSLVPPDVYEANLPEHEANPNEKKRKRDEVEVEDKNRSKSRTKNSKKPGGRRARRSRKSKK